MGYQWHEDILRVPGDILVKMSTVHLDAGSAMPPHSHHTLELSMVISGEGEYRVGEAAYPVRIGDIVLFNNIELHRMRNTGTEPLTNMALEFEPRFIWSDPLYSFDKAFLTMFFTRGKHFSHKLNAANPMFASIQQHFLEIRQEFVDQLPRYEVLIKAKLLTILANMLRYYDMTREDDGPTVRHQQEMEQMLSYIAAHYAEPLSTKALADRLYLHPAYFSRLFHAVNGLSPMEYIVRVRIVAATQMLKTTDTDVLEIAQACGFNSPSHFYTTFKRITGKSPAQYRASSAD